MNTKTMCEMLRNPVLTLDRYNMAPMDRAVMKGIADYIEQQEKQIKSLQDTEFQREELFLQNRKDAELGRLAVVTIKNAKKKIIKERKADEITKYDAYHAWWIIDFIESQLRAELLKVGE